MRLDLSQVLQFHETGYLLIKKVFAGDELEALQSASATVVDEAVRGEGRGHWRQKVEDPTSYFRSERMLERSEVFLSAALNPDLLRCVGQCLDAPFMLLNDALITKLPRSSVVVHWHQDPPYQGEVGRSETFGFPNFVADIYLDPSTPESGCIYATPSRHLSGRIAVEDYDDAQLFAHPDTEPIIAEPGDVSFHAISAPHGSPANVSARMRRILLFHYVTRQVYEHDYRDWMHLYGGFGPEAMALLQRGRAMREARYGAEDCNDLSLSESGIAYRGCGVGQPDSWGRLIALLSCEDQARRRRLDIGTT
jgi:ectoine hydroxylase-related dioxygenase (phytanoyl-CoA dioxygenase family)